MTGPTIMLETSAAIIGQSGAGKSFTAKGVVEELLRLERHTCVVDPTGIWWGLRSNAAGDRPGFNLPIFGGLHGDVPITAGDGGKVARLIIDGPLSAVIDLSELRTGADQRYFMRDFMATIRTKPRTRFHLVIDEADEFAPQTVADTAGQNLLEDMIWIAKRGRVHGFVPLLITQRPADIAKSVLSQMKVLILHRLIAPTDQAPVAAYLKSHGTKAETTEVMGSLARLADGERWIYAPTDHMLDRGFSPMIETFDSGRTPEAGESPPVPATLASIDVSALIAALKPVETVADKGEEITEKGSAGNGLASRQAAEEIARLRADLASAAQREAGLQWTLAGYQRAERAYNCLVGDVLWPSAPRHDGSATTDPYVVPPLYEIPAPSGQEFAPPSGEKIRSAKDGVREAVSRTLPAPEAASHPSALGTTTRPPRHHRILDALAWTETFLKRPAVPRGIVAFIAGASSASSSYSNDLSALRTAGMIEYPGAGLLELTVGGRAAANWPSAAPTTEELLRAIGERLEPRHNRILRALAGMYPAPLRRAELAGIVGASAISSSFSNDLSKLKTLGLIEYPGPGMLRAADALFGEAK